MVIGASADIGSKLIDSIANNYSKIVAHYLHWNDDLEILKRKYGSKLVFLQADLCDAELWDNVLRTLTEQNIYPDHIVHLSSPKIITQKFHKSAWDLFQAGWEISVRSAYAVCQHFLPHMQQNKYGKILFMLSANTLNMPPKFQAAYTTIKYALLGLMKSLSGEYAEKGVFVYGVSPDMVKTKFLSKLPELMVEQYALSRPKKEILSVTDVVSVMAFLLSDCGDHLYGENIAIR